MQAKIQYVVIFSFKFDYNLAGGYVLLQADLEWIN
jgi:hypothetical protein